MNDGPATRSIVDHATCLACGCLCDDIGVEVEDGRIVEASRACPKGRDWFLAPRPGEGHPVASIDGLPAELEQAIARAAEILGASKAPLIWGLTETTNEAVRAALAIADRIGAVVDPMVEDAARLAAFQRVGQVSASLGEVKDRADVVVFWGADPLVTHPRHWERYSVEPRGRFIPEGRAGRFVIVVDFKPTETSQAADLFVQVGPERQTEALEVLRAMVKGIQLDPERAEQWTGVAFSNLKSLAACLTSARYGAFFLGDRFDWGEPDASASAAASSLVRDLDDGRRFVMIEMGGPFNPTGASAVLTWQAGAPRAIDFGPGYPRHLPGEATLDDRVVGRSVDALLVVANDARKLLVANPYIPGIQEIPMVVLSPGDATAWDRPETVVIDVARTGIEAGGTVARVDGVMLPLRPALDSGLPTDREVLDAIGRRLDALN